MFRLTSEAFKAFNLKSLRFSRALDLRLQNVIANRRRSEDLESLLEGAIAVSQRR